MKPGLSGCWHPEDHFEYQHAYGIGRQNFQKIITGEGGTISNNRVGWQTQSLLV